MAADVMHGLCRGKGRAQRALETMGLGAVLILANVGHAQEVRVVYVGDSARREIAAGVAMAMEEAGHTGALLGRRVAVVASAADSAAIARAVRVQPSVLVVGGDAELVRSVARTAAQNAVPVFNAGAGSQALRRELCGVRHIIASDALLAAATSSVQQGKAVQWSGRFERYGAAQLNDRFRARFERDMTGDAWAGWIAVKIATEAAFRSRARTTAELERWLASPNARFDGHKGVPLTFRAADGQLRHPVLVLDAKGAVAAEVPRAGPDAPGGFDAAFDVLVPPAANCEATP